MAVRFKRICSYKNEKLIWALIKKIKNTGEERYQIALERIFALNLRAPGQSFLYSEMNELAVYALTGKLSCDNPTWEPSQRDLDKIDYGKPKGLDFLEKEFQKEWDKMYEKGWIT